MGIQIWDFQGPIEYFYKYISYQWSMIRHGSLSVFLTNTNVSKPWIVPECCAFFLVLVLLVVIILQYCENSNHIEQNSLYVISMPNRIQMLVVVVVVDWCVTVSSHSLSQQKSLSASLRLPHRCSGWGHNVTKRERMVLWYSECDASPPQTNRLETVQYRGCSRRFT